MSTRSLQEITPARILQAYEAGFFPMAGSRDGRISWYCPDPRAIIPLDNFRVSRSLRQTARRGGMEIRINTSFAEVMRHCAAREDTWISAEIIDLYCALFNMGCAHSIECWRMEELVGGLYGVALGGAFFGESMFSLIRDASKLALWSLVRRLQERGFLLLDTQFLTPHLASLGACEIPREEYLVLLQKALRQGVKFID